MTTCRTLTILDSYILAYLRDLGPRDLECMGCQVAATGLMVDILDLRLARSDGSCTQHSIDSDDTYVTRTAARSREPIPAGTKIVFAVSTIFLKISWSRTKSVRRRLSRTKSVRRRCNQIVMYLTFIVFCTRALPCPPLKMRCTHGRLPRRSSPPGQLTATEMTPRPL